jgi:hypothetical protein
LFGRGLPAVDERGFQDEYRARRHQLSLLIFCLTQIEKPRIASGLFVLKEAKCELPRKNLKNEKQIAVAGNRKLARRWVKFRFEICACNGTRPHQTSQ